MQRIDTFLVEHGLAESREQAKRLILAGAVTVNGNTRIKPGQRVSADAKIVVQEPQRYVSRGGFKLEKALSLFDVDVEDRVALDVGASTGGFTDCLLQHGAKFVYAVDVGYGQLAWKLRTHPQVQSIEKTNIRYLTPTLLNRGEVTAPLHNSDDFISIAAIDVSFISLRTVLPSVIKILKQQNGYQSSVRFFCEKPFGCQLRGGLTESESSLTDNRQLTTNNYNIIALLKPQFEAGKVHVKKGGIVADKQVHIQTIENLSGFVTDKLGATVRGLTYSPIHKDIGNIEYLLWLTIEPDTQARAPEKGVQPQQTTAEVVAEAHEAFET
ncbi:TlyA family RNA methyltransferase [Candidatus Poribacteria bacterium]|nr:TlyA family RNA methyltransferase [Candidatus Poribacteria bacterium]MYH80774.1 TlyA family RNA methyltransferase [Candidatus Poribacteria bacterium]MYK96135.1 TlyA family RNA methyltransferase [Candidatus Poribacteria bacterium]